ncbi:WD40/YVTN/BNR-like repeat-containing protein [Alkalimarinus sediminis]|uniref:YCF48-related protein n=1 Tax=Alkalimarinus sediminis TaxID=1632866 RepID=A0A9E8HJA3_9ALTE|nr:YCF48-related protein [Alkalimarinus sediminis]UZW75718.1 YCF48-related protein [Alkalimarinus sediminis]
MSTQIAHQSLLLDVVAAGNRLVAVGERGHIIYSDDQGSTWTQASVPVSVTLTAVHFPTDTQGWAVGHGGIILHSTDSGTTWAKQFDGNLANQQVIDQAEERVAKIEQELESAPEDQQADIEFQLEEAQFGLEDAQFDAETGPSKPLLDVWFANELKGFAVGAYGFFFATDDGGKNWYNVSSRIDNQDRFHLNAISEVVGGSLFVVGEAGNIFRSNDIGDTWERVDSPYEGSFFGVNGTGNVNEVLVFGLRGNLYRSIDLGASWTRINTGNEATLIAAGQGDDGIVTVVGNSGIVLVSGNAGESFQAVVRENRQALSAVHLLENGNFLLVGEHGVDISGPTGRNL